MRAGLVVLLLACAAPMPEPETPPCILYQPPATPEKWELAIRVRDGCYVRMMTPIPPTEGL